MTDPTFLLFFIPVCLVVMVALEAGRSDDPVRIAKRALRNFGLLALVLTAGVFGVYLLIGLL